MGANADRSGRTAATTTSVKRLDSTHGGGYGGSSAVLSPPLRQQVHSFGGATNTAMEDSKESEFGPLPISDHASVLQRRSIAALKRQLPESEFLFRDERVDDFGVDGALEIFVEGRATNMRAQVQLKARTGTEENADGTVSVSLETSNLNYLLNGVCPTYVLYRPEQDEVRFAFARDEWARISKTTPDWRNQRTISIRFAHVLNESTVSEFRAAVIETARFQRDLHEKAAQLAGGTSRLVYVDPSSMEVTDSEAIAKFLSENGLSLVTSGAAQIVAEKGRLIPEAVLRQFPIALLALGFADYSRGRYIEADGYLRTLTLVGDSALSDEDRGFTAYLLNSIDYLTGRVRRDEFLLSADTWLRTAPPHLAIQYTIAIAWEHYAEALSGLDPAAQDNAARPLRSILAKAKTLGSEPIREQAELRELLLDAHSLTSAYVDAQASAYGLLPQIQASAAVETLERVQSRWGAWKARVAALSQVALNRGNFYAFCEAETLACHAELVVYRQEAWFREMANRPSAPASQVLADRLQQTLAFAQKIENLDLELRAQLELAEFADTIGQPDEAKRLAQSVQFRARLYRYAALDRAATRLLSGSESFASRIDEVRKMRDHGQDDFWLQASDAQLQAMAHDACKTFGVPVGRAKNFLPSLVAERELVARRRDWCRFMAFQEQDASESEPEAMFAAPTLKRIVCTHFRTASAFPHPDAVALVRAFVRTHCEGCTARQHEGAANPG